MIRRILFSAVILVLVRAPLDAQTSDHENRRTASVFLSVGGLMLDAEGLNASLGAHGYSEMSDRFFSLGAGGLLVINQAILGVEGHSLLAEQASSTNGTFRASMAGRYGMLDFGYLVYEGESLDVYPLLGVGYGHTSLDILDPSGRTFDDVLTDPRRGVALEKEGFLLGISVGGDYVFEVGRGRRRGPLLGVRIGYNYSPVENEWSMDGTPLLGGPELSLTGGFVRILLGWGGRGASWTSGR